MSATEQVAKLEALLARVNGRRNAPRAAVAHVDVAHAEAAPAAPPKVVEPAAKTPVPASVAPAPVAKTPAPAPVAAAPAAPPKPAAAAPSPAAATPAPAPVAPVAAKAPAKPAPVSEPSDVDVVVEEGVAEVDLDGLDEEEAAVSLRDSVADLDAVAGGSSAANDEPAASSRRPIHLQPAAHALTDAAEAKAPHAAPPESGRQVAIPPAADVDDELLKSGVRVLPPVQETPPPGAVPAVAAAPAPAVALKPDVTRPAIPVVSPAAFHGAVPAPPPATFGELLDSTLSL